MRTTTRKQADTRDRAFCANHVGGGPRLDFVRGPDAIFLNPCPTCGGGGVVITVQAWRHMRRKPVQ